MDKNLKSGIEALKKCRAVADRKPLKAGSVYTEELAGIYDVLGNGDQDKGFEFLTSLIKGLTRARAVHPPKEWKAGGEVFAMKALASEFSEVCHARTETPKEIRMKEEVTDLIIVGNRIYNEEWK